MKGGKTMKELFTQEELLKYALSQGMIDIDNVRHRVEMDELKAIAAEYEDKIMPPQRGYLVVRIINRVQVSTKIKYANFPDTNDGRKQAVDSAKQELYKKIASRLKTEKNKCHEPTLNEVFEAWNISKEGEIKEDSIIKYIDTRKAIGDLALSI